MRLNAKCLQSAVAATLFCSTMSSRAAVTNLEQEVRELREQNGVLQKQLQTQGGLLDALSEKVSGSGFVLRSCSLPACHVYHRRRRQ